MRFLSCEPLLGSLRLDLTGIDWIIVGGESGHKYRSIKADWVRDLQNQAKAYGVAFFFKQWGGLHSKAAGRLLDGQIWDEMPEVWHQHLKQWGGDTVATTKRLRKTDLSLTSPAEK